MEHFDRATVHRVLKNWHCFLRPGGMLRLSVPDIDALFHLYHFNGTKIDVIEQPIMGGQLNRYDYHKSMFTLEKLIRVLEECGFFDVTSWSPG